MRFKFIPNKLRHQVNNIFNKNERLATQVVQPLPTSKFDISYRHITTFDSGKLIPIMCKEVLPGDIWDIDISTLIKLSTPAAATMENAIYDIACFFVPNRIIYPEWKFFQGENKSAGFQKDYTTLPLVSYDTSLKYDANDFASYIGFVQNRDMSKIGLPISALWFKAYIQIWNDYFRDENLEAEIDNTNNNKNTENVKVSDYIGKPINQSLQIGKGLATVSRLTDYFSTCLPYPQKGDAVSINNLPLASLSVSGSIRNAEHPETLDLFSPKYYLSNGTVIKQNKYLQTSASNGETYAEGSAGNPGLHTYLSLQLKNGKITSDGSAPLYNVNDLRLAIALQHLRELDARGGTRYIEILLNHWGVMSSDARLQRAEYIGGMRSNINIQNVVQSSASVGNSPLGVMGGVSVSSDTTPRKISFATEEHGIIMAFIIVRPQVNYSQGLDKQFTRVQKLDFYDPQFAHIGEQPVYKHELYLDDTDGDLNTNNEIFGYNEAWADYRYSKNQMSGYMSVNNDLSLASLYSYTEKYSNAPVLGEQWIKANPEVIGDTLLLNSSKMEYIHQFIGDFYFNAQVERRMPVYSQPGIHKI